MNGIRRLVENNGLIWRVLVVQLAILADVYAMGGSCWELCARLAETGRGHAAIIGVVMILRRRRPAPRSGAREAPSRTRSRASQGHFEVAARMFEKPVNPSHSPNRESETGFAGGLFAGRSYAAGREQSLGGRLMGEQARRFGASEAGGHPSLTPWVSDFQRWSQSATGCSRRRRLPPHLNTSSWLQVICAHQR